MVNIAQYYIFYLRLSDFCFSLKYLNFTSLEYFYHFYSFLVRVDSTLLNYCGHNCGINSMYTSFSKHFQNTNENDKHGAFGELQLSHSSSSLDSGSYHSALSLNSNFVCPSIELELNDDDDASEFQVDTSLCIDYCNTEEYCWYYSITWRLYLVYQFSIMFYYYQEWFWSHQQCTSWQ